MAVDFASRHDERALRRDERTAAIHAQALASHERARTIRTDRPASTNSGGGDSAFDKFYGTPFYQVPLREGIEQVNSNYAARGALESGAAEKSILKYGQDHASSALGDWIQLLQGQQGVGLGATNSYVGSTGAYGNNIAALGTNFATGNNIASGNYVSALGNLYSNQANAQSAAAQNTGTINSNAAVARANNNNGMWGGIGSALTGAAGMMAYSPYSAAYGAPGGTNYATLPGYANA